MLYWDNGKATKKISHIFSWPNFIVLIFMKKEEL